MHATLQRMNIAKDLQNLNIYFQKYKNMTITKFFLRKGAKLLHLCLTHFITPCTIYFKATIKNELRKKETNKTALYKINQTYLSVIILS